MAVIATWLHSYKATEPHGHIATEPQTVPERGGAAEGWLAFVEATGGRLPLWLCSYVAVTWLCGCGNVAVWLYSYVAINH